MLPRRGDFFRARSWKKLSILVVIFAHFVAKKYIKTDNSSRPAAVINYSAIYDQNKLPKRSYYAKHGN
jgi:hypothetical protein